MSKRFTGMNSDTLITGPQNALVVTPTLQTVNLRLRED